MKSDLSNKLLNLQEASQRLNVSVEDLIRWNEYNILKPTITPEGTIGYTEVQISQFLTIKKLVQEVKSFPDTIDEESKLESQNRIFEADTLNSNTFSQNSDEYFHNNLYEKNFTVKQDELASNRVDYTQPTSPKSSFLFFNLPLAVIVLVLVFAALANINKMDSKSIISYNGTPKVLSENVGNFDSNEIIENQTHSEKINNSVTNSELKPIGDNVIKQRFKVQDILFSKSQDVTQSAIYKKVASNDTSQNRILNTLIKGENISNEKNNDGLTSTTYAFRGSNNSDENLVFDEGGKIKGEARDTLSSSFGDIGILSNSVPKQLNSRPLNSVSLLAIGLLSLIYLYPRNLAFTGKISRKQNLESNNQFDNTQKIIEVDQKTDGTIVLFFQGNEYKISKPELHSESDQFIERIMGLVQHGIKKIEYVSSNDDDIDIKTPLSRLVTRLGFVGLKRELFFPRTAKDRVLFRKYITAKDLSNMNITTVQILADLV